MTPKYRSKHREHLRNILLIIIAIGSIVFFFSLDFGGDGESVFSRSAKNKIRFSGDLKSNAYTSEEIDKIRKFVSKYNDEIENLEIQTTRQDAYKKVTDKSPIIFEVHLEMTGGATITTSTRRARRNELADAILVKLKKDVGAYIKLKKEGKNIKSLHNTM